MGTVVSIHTAPAAGAAMVARAEVRAVPGTGLDGDRYAAGEGAWQRRGTKPKQQMTLIELEALEALVRDYQITLGEHETRRNITTEGVALNHLVGREFQVGDVRVRGLELCEPCGYLEEKTGKAVRAGLVHRGGLRCEILSEGVIRVGDAVGGCEVTVTCRDLH
ncbi:MAG: MOSC domain-containing protein [Candidatus Sumerlaeia bacterium]|nr:MOSC domain-containing protein [Candidatus Sumerlaeia bacterium]